MIEIIGNIHRIRVLLVCLKLAIISPIGANKSLSLAFFLEGLILRGRISNKL
jgi:hypothetical protein